MLDIYICYMFSIYLVLQGIRQYAYGPSARLVRNVKSSVSKDAYYYIFTISYEP